MSQADSAAPPTAPPEAGRIVAMMTAFEQTAALTAALRVDLFTAVAQGADTAQRLAERCDCALRGVRVLADALCVYGLLSKCDDSYTLAADAAAFLDRRSSRYIGDAAQFLASPEKIALYFDDPEGWVRRGGPATQANVTPDSSVWVDFARGMANFMAPVATSAAELLKVRLDPPPQRILDVAAGHGLFGVAALKAFPGAEVAALDWEAVLAVAAETAEVFGVQDRWTGRPGSAFDLDASAAYDLVLVPNFLHHFDLSTCVGFLRQVVAGLRPGGVLAIIEYTPDATRIWPPAPALFALSMLTGTPAGDAYTAKELEVMCVKAGCSSVTIEPVPETVQTLLIARKGAADPSRASSTPPAP